MIKGFHGDTNPYKNQVELWKYKGCDVWNLEVNAGQYGEDRAEISFEAKGFKDAQEQATKQLIQLIKKGLELTLY